ncbi:MAG: type II toxin-antitoxin system Phd/YefM family antitoxin [Candidatus Omnitrophica bacterium]|nr:type II toxin-antitoxin system Phd/YefM family antitoxin [Candidatus Omnitrophota bacterium]
MIPLERHVSAYQVRTRFGEILDAVRYRKEPVVVEKNGRPAAVIVDLEAYRALETLREEERFIEEYTDERLRGFLVADRLPKAEAAHIRKRLKAAR